MWFFSTGSPAKNQRAQTTIIALLAEDIAQMASCAQAGIEQRLRIGEQKNLICGRNVDAQVTKALRQQAQSQAMPDWA